MIAIFCYDGSNQGYNRNYSYCSFSRKIIKGFLFNHVTVVGPLFLFIF